MKHAGIRVISQRKKRFLHSYREIQKFCKFRLRQKRAFSFPIRRTGVLSVFQYGRDAVTLPLLLYCCIGLQIVVLFVIFHAFLAQYTTVSTVSLSETLGVHAGFSGALDIKRHLFNAVSPGNMKQNYPGQPLWAILVPRHGHRKKGSFHV